MDGASDTESGTISRRFRLPYFALSFDLIELENSKYPIYNLLFKLIT